MRSVLLSVVLVAGTSATIFFLNARSPEVVRRMKRPRSEHNWPHASCLACTSLRARFNVGEDLSWDPAREASLVLAKPTAYRHSFSSAWAAANSKTPTASQSMLVPPYIVAGGNATTRIESLRSITRNSSITSAAAGRYHASEWYGRNEENDGTC